MSYASLVKIPETLGSSTSLAVIASLGIHGLLLAVLPVLPFESKSLESTSQRTVGLIELTPAEQSRLPQVTTSDVTLPPFATQQSALPPLPPPPPIQSGLPPLPSYQLPLNYPTVFNNPVRASSPQTKTFRVRRPSVPTQNKRSIPPVIAFNKTADSVRVRSFIPTQNNRSTPPSGIAINKPANSPLNQNQIYRSGKFLPPPPNSGLPSTSGLTPQPFDPNNFPLEPPIPPAPSQQPVQANTNSQNTNRPQNQQIAANPQNTNQQRQQIAANPQTKPLTPTVGRQQLPERTKRELLAKRDQLTKIKREARLQPVPPTPQNTPVRSREQLEAALQQKLRAQPQSNPASSESQTTAQAIRQLDEYQAQRQKVQQNHPKVKTKQPVRQTIKTCKKQFDNSVAYLNAVVNPQGKLVSGPTLYTKSGTVDTQQAIARVRNYPFRANSDTTTYDFAIEFKYDTDNCSEPTPQASPGTN